MTWGEFVSPSLCWSLQIRKRTCCSIAESRLLTKQLSQLRFEDASCLFVEACRLQFSLTDVEKVVTYLARHALAPGVHDLEKGKVIKSSSQKPATSPLGGLDACLVHGRLRPISCPCVEQSGSYQGLASCMHWFPGVGSMAASGQSSFLSLKMTNCVPISPWLNQVNAGLQNVQTNFIRCPLEPKW